MMLRGKYRMANMLANIFGSSPVRPLEKHIGIAYRCAKQLQPFFSAANKGNWDKALAARDMIEKLEHEADDIKKKIRLQLPKSLFMPVPREDLLELLLVQDKIANRTKDVSGLVVGRKLQMPSRSRPAKAFVNSTNYSLRDFVVPRSLWSRVLLKSSI